MDSFFFNCPGNSRESFINFSRESFKLAILTLIDIFPFRNLKRNSKNEYWFGEAFNITLIFPQVTNTFVNSSAVAGMTDSIMSSCH